MKRFFVSFVLIFTLIFSVFAGDNKKAHRELRREFEKFSGLSELKARGFDLKKLDEIDDMTEMKNYLEAYFVDENGMPLDNHVFIQFILMNKKYRVRTGMSMFIDFSDEYGSKDELLEKGYIENENIFYYPLYNGEWHEDGYRVGKKYMSNEKYNDRSFNYSVNSEKALLVGLGDFFIENNKDDNKEYYDEISKSKKEYLILDLSRNKGGSLSSYDGLVKSVKKMSPKEIFILCNSTTKSMGECVCYLIENDTNIKTTIIGYPTWGGLNGGKKSKIIKFDYFDIEVWLDDSYGKENGQEQSLPFGKQHNLTEGIGFTPDIYTDGSASTSLEVIKHLIGDDELSLPSYY